MYLLPVLLGFGVKEQMIALFYACLFSVLAYATTKPLLKRDHRESWNLAMSLGCAVFYASFQIYSMINNASTPYAGNENGDCCGLMDGGIAVIFVFGFMLWVCFALCYFFNRLVDRFD